MPNITAINMVLIHYFDRMAVQYRCMMLYFNGVKRPT